MSSSFVSGRSSESRLLILILQGSRRRMLGRYPGQLGPKKEHIVWGQQGITGLQLRQLVISILKTDCSQ